MAPQPLSLFDLAPGKTLAGRFEIVRPHRRNDFASIFEVNDLENGERCELTFFPSSLFENPDQEQEFQSAWEIWKRIESPHVAPVIDTLLLEGAGLILVAAFSAGRTLRAVLDEEGKLTLAQVRDLGLQLLDGCMAIHGAGLVHGDIKPSTILLADQEDGTRRAVLMDGGVTPGLWHAKRLGEHTALIGTPLYAPVEQFGGEAPDVQSDVYNVSTVLFEGAAGVMPWPGKNFLEVFQAKLDKAAPSMTQRAPGVEVDPALEQAVVGGLLADRLERYPSAEAFHRALVDVGVA